MYLKDLNALQRKAYRQLKAVSAITELTLNGRNCGGYVLVTGKRNGTPFRYVLTPHGYINEAHAIHGF
jgi:hypothetical protein